MPTYRTTSRNQLRSPSGAVNEAPDGPGAMATMLDDVDNYLGVGGAEYQANASPGISGIPSSRLFLGKLAYSASADIVYRYVGAGNTALGSTNPTAKWQAWEKPPTAYTPAFVNLSGVNVNAVWGIAAGLVYCMIDAVSSSGYAITPATDVTASIPSPFVANYLSGRGIYYRGGSTSNNSLWDLVCFSPLTGVQSGSTFRIRATVQTGAAAGAQTSANQMGNVIPSPYNSDRFTLEARAPSAQVI